MQKLLTLSFLLLTSVATAQKIDIIKLGKGFREIDFTRPTVAARVDPIPNQPGTYRFTHFMGVVCTDDQSGEQGELYQYVNMTNGVVGIFGDDIARMIPESQHQDSRMDFWAWMPNMTQRMYTNSAEHGKPVMQATSGDGMHTTTMARFDAWNEGTMFWQNARKIKTTTLPAPLLNGNRTPIALDVYDYTSDEGKIQVWLKDIGPAEGQHAPLKSIHLATGMGGLGLVRNPMNNHVYLAFQVNDAANTKGCRLFEFRPKTHLFSGASYKPMGDLILDKLTEAQKEQAQHQQEKLEEISQEEDARLRELLAEKARMEADIRKQLSAGMANTALFNDASEATRTQIQLMSNGEDQYRLADLELNIQQRRLEIELDQLNRSGASAEDKLAIKRKMNCIPAQRQNWQQYKNEVQTLRKKYKSPESDADFLEKMGVLSTQFYERMMRTCP
ncbi:hypothetical protein GCM10028807_54970 [Spirosoma daeguense]